MFLLFWLKKKKGSRGAVIKEIDLWSVVHSHGINKEVEGVVIRTGNGLRNHRLGFKLTSCVRIVKPFNLSNPQSHYA